MSSDLDWHTIESELLHDCKIFQLYRERKKHDAKEDNFFILQSNDWVNIIPVTREGNVVMIEQYRYGTEMVTLEIPGGIMNDGETPAQSARREMNEETGYDTHDIYFLGKNEPNPAFLRNNCSSFLALNAECTVGTAFDEHENIRVRLIPLREIPALIRNGTIKHSLVIVAFHDLHLHRELLPSHIIY